MYDQWINFTKHFSLFRHIKLELLTRESAADDACTLCYDRTADAVVKPCGHKGFCKTCMAALAGQPAPVCPICRGPIEGLETV